MSKAKIQTNSLFTQTPQGVDQKAPRISQSLMKDMRAFIAGIACGVFIKERWINGRLLGDPSDSMQYGIYFEYILTGSLPKDGKVPEPKWMLAALKKPVGQRTVEDMMAPYRQAHENKARVEEYWRMMGFEIYNPLNSGPQAGIKKTKGRFDGVFDIVMIATRDVTFASGMKLKKDQIFIVDIKYSGLLEDKWSVHGWQWTPQQKEYHGTQVKQYRFLTDNALEFFFLIVDPGGKYVKWFHPVVSDFEIERHVQEGNELYDKLMFLHTEGLLVARPESNKCAACPLFEECEHKHVFPHPIDVDLTIE
jgi:hypothetical protein